MVDLSPKALMQVAQGHLNGRSWGKMRVNIYVLLRIHEHECTFRAQVRQGMTGSLHDRL